MTAALCVVLVAAVAGVTLSGTAGAAGAENEAPLAEAGLDQNVTVNATVYLDASGSRDPDGEVTDYEWRLERPDGTYTRPDCRTCGRTSFVARQVGIYNATVTVTDDDGTTSSDTLRVHVQESDGPTVTLSGPGEMNAGEVVGYSASIEAGSAELTAVTWRVDGNWQNRTGISGESATAAYLHAFSTSGDQTVSVTVVDRLGREQTATKAVTVHEPTAESRSTTGGDSAGRECSQFNRDDDRYCNNDRMTLDSNGITISDTDNDGTTEWGGQTMDEEFAQNHDGVSYDSTDGVVEFESQEAYTSALNVDEVILDPDTDTTENTDNQEEADSEKDDNDSNRFGGSSSDDNGDNGSTDGEDGNEDTDGGGESSDNSGGDDTTDNSNNEENDATEDSDTEENDPNTRTGRVPPGRGGYGGF
ncbi:PKD domain-containing protein [Halosimplex sp. J119]